MPFKTGFGLPPSAMRPWIPDSRAVRATDGEEKATDGGRLERLYRPSSPDSCPWPAISGCLLAVVVALVTEVLPGVLDGEGTGDALVGGSSLPVDAVGADLEQDRDAVAGGLTRWRLCCCAEGCLTLPLGEPAHWALSGGLPSTRTWRWLVEEISIGEFARRSRLSPKALRFYDCVGLLPPARVDELSGYRYYEDTQLEQARLIATLRQAGLPISTVKELLALDPAEMAKQVTAFWQAAETRHAGQRELVAALVSRLTGRSTVMHEVETRQMPQRSLLCLKRNVDESGIWAFGKEFIAIIRDRRLPRMEGREGAFFCIFWGQVSADSDGPVEFCKPVPDAEAEGLAAQCPELTLRVEPAHREAYVNVGRRGGRARHGAVARRRGPADLG